MVSKASPAPFKGNLELKWRHIVVINVSLILAITLHVTATQLSLKYLSATLIPVFVTATILAKNNYTKLESALCSALILVAIYNDLIKERYVAEETVLATFGVGNALYIVFIIFALKAFKSQEYYMPETMKKGWNAIILSTLAITAAVLPLVIIIKSVP